jgi:protease IV
MKPSLPEPYSKHWLSATLLGLCVLAIIVSVLSNFGDLLQQGGKSSGIASGSDSTLAASGKDYLALVELQGPISGAPENGGPFGANDSAAKAARKQIDEAANDSRVKGVLLFIDSPGGTVGMSQELHAAVGRLREKKPVVASMGDVAASGGYYTAVAADRIVANRGTLTASIGVIINGMNFKGLVTDRLGVKAVTYKSGLHKDILSPYREPSDSDRKLIQGLVDESYADFLSAVIEGRTRNLEGEDKVKRANVIRSVADGRVVLGTQALRYGLVDKVGDYQTAKEVLEKLVNKKEGKRKDHSWALQPYKKGGKLFDLFGLDAMTPLARLQWIVSGAMGTGSTYGGAYGAPLQSSALTVSHAASTSGLPVGMPLPYSMTHSNRLLWMMDGAY